MKSPLPPNAPKDARYESALFSNEQDLRRFTLMRTLMACAHMLEVVLDHDLQATGISLPRMRLLMRLYIEERRGNKEGVSPSLLSRHQHISKNTISSLLASLEDQQLIERTLSSEDKRSFQIRLTKQGRQMLQKRLPAQNSALTQVFSSVTPDEQKTLIQILGKLRESLIQQIHECNLDSYRTREE